MRETAAGERRVAASPETVRKLASLGAAVAVAEGAGLGAAMTDDAYRAAGATIESPDTVCADADVVLCVRAPDAARLSAMKRGAALIGMLNPYQDRGFIEACAAQGLRAF